VKATLSKEATRIAYIADDIGCRPILGQIKIEHGKATACDGFMMVQVPAEMENEEDCILIEAKDILKAKKLGGRGLEKLVIESDGKTASIEIIGGEHSGTKIASEIPKGNYPLVEQLFPTTERQAYVALSARLLRKLLMTISIDAIIKIRVREQTQAVEFIVENGKSHCVMMPLFIQEESELWSRGKKK